jgi:hypothetical protein
MAPLEYLCLRPGGGLPGEPVPQEKHHPMMAMHTECVHIAGRMPAAADDRHNMVEVRAPLLKRRPTDCTRMPLPFEDLLNNGGGDISTTDLSSTATPARKAALHHPIQRILLRLTHKKVKRRPLFHKTRHKPSFSLKRRCSAASMNRGSAVPEKRIPGYPTGLFLGETYYDHQETENMQCITR